jgi:CRP-like cAMP-binding protein
METDLLIANIKKYVPLTIDEENDIIGSTILRYFAKGQVINKEGETSRYTNFIISGSARVYYIDTAGQEHVVQLGIRDWWISDYSSFIMQQPGLLHCEALEPTTVLAISYENLQQLFDKIPMMDRFYRIMIQMAYASFQKRVLQSLSMDAEKRYVAFKNAYPLMDQQISQKDIASYLGMSAEFLSKIKKRLVLKAQNKL